MHLTQSMTAFKVLWFTIVIVFFIGMLGGSLAASTESNNVQQTKLLPQVQTIETLLNEADDHYFGGIYLDGHRAVVQIVERYQDKAMMNLSTHEMTDDISFETVMYSHKELNEAYEKLNQALLTEEIIKGKVDYEGAWGIDTRNNRIVLMTRDERVIEKAIEIIEPDMLRYSNPVKVVDQRIAETD